MRTLTYLTLIAALSTVSLPALAGHKGGGGANGNGHSSTDRMTGSDRAGSRMSDQGTANTNGPNATDHGTGLDRAEERMNTQGSKHSKAKSHKKKHGSDN